MEHFSLAALWRCGPRTRDLFFVFYSVSWDELTNYEMHEQHFAAATPRQGRAIRGRAARRARKRARGAAKCGQFSGTSNESIFAAICTLTAAPRRSQCVATMRDV
jgi:hypothetical protein